MKPRSLILVVALLAASPAVAQDRQGRQRDPGAAAQSGGGERREGPREAAPRNESGRREAPSPPAPAAAAPAPAAVAPPAIPRAAQAPDRGESSAQPRRYPGPDNRQAVPRSTRPVPVPDGSRYRGPVYGQPRVYNNYYYYPRHSYPYGYGAFGLGYFYYNPYVWGASYGGYYGYDPYYDYYGRPGYSGYGGYPTGELRLDVSPRYADVYVDGYFAGRVDDFDGVFQSLRLEEGPHRIRVIAQGFEPMDVDVRIYAGQKITYRGDLLPRRP